MPQNLPEKLSIEHLKKQAKQLLKAFRSGDSSAFQAFRLIRRYSAMQLPEFLKSPVKLHDAQFAVALQYGFQSWQKLSAYCTQNDKEDNMSEKINKAFYDLKGLKNRAMQRLLRQIDSRILAMALTNAEEGIRQKVFLNMSSRAVRLLKNDIATGDTVSESAVLKSREKILDILKKLSDEGEISGGTDNKETVPEKIECVASLKKKKLSLFSTDELKAFFYDLAAKAHTYGILSLESDAEASDDAIIKKGLELITDGTDPSIVESVLRAKLEKALRDFRIKYESSINAVLDIQNGNYPELVKEKLDASL